MLRRQKGPFSLCINKSYWFHTSWADCTNAIFKRTHAAPYGSNWTAVHCAAFSTEAISNRHSFNNTKTAPMVKLHRCCVHQLGHISPSKLQSQSTQWRTRFFSHKAHAYAAQLPTSTEDFIQRTPLEGDKGFKNLSLDKPLNCLDLFDFFFNLLKTYTTLYKENITVRSNKKSNKGSLSSGLPN